MNKDEELIKINNKLKELKNKRKELDFNTKEASEINKKDLYKKLINTEDIFTAYIISKAL